MFTNIQDAVLGSKITFLQIIRISLNIHVGICDKESEIEALFFPSREIIQIWIEKY